MYKERNQVTSPDNIEKALGSFIHWDLFIIQKQEHDWLDIQRDPGCLVLAAQI